MTLTDIMPTLRLSIPDPHDLHRWPTGTAIALDDVVLGECSVVTAADRLGTRAFIPAPADGECSTPIGGQYDSSVIGIWVHTVTAVLSGDESPVAMLDGCVASEGAVWDEVRLIGRISVAHRHPYAVFADGDNSCPPSEKPLRHSRVHAFLPSDLRVGDLLAVPALAPTALAESAAIDVTAPTVHSGCEGGYRVSAVKVSTVIGGHR